MFHIFQLFLLFFHYCSARFLACSTLFRTPLSLFSTFLFTKHLVKCTSLNANCAVTNNRVHQGSGSRTPRAHKRLCSTCASCAFVEVSTPIRFNKISGFWSSGMPTLVQILAFHVIDVGCRDKLRHSCFVVVHWCVPLPLFVTVHQLALNPISVPISVIPTCVPTFVTIRHLALDPIFNFCDHSQSRSDPKF